MINVSACGIIDMDSPNATMMREIFKNQGEQKRATIWGEEKQKIRNPPPVASL
jgi:2-methylcitrate dehydratase PrpD